MGWTRVIFLGLISSVALFSAGCSQKLPDRAEPGFLELREIHQRTVDLSEEEFAQVHIAMLQLAMDKGSASAPRRYIADVGTKKTGFSYNEAVFCPELRETVFGEQVPCIDNVRFEVTRINDRAETTLELHVTRHMPTSAWRSNDGNFRDRRLQNKDYRPIEHDAVIHAQVFSELSDQLGLGKYGSTENVMLDSTLSGERLVETRRFFGTRPEDVAAATSSALRELGETGVCSQTVFDMSASYSEANSYYCIVGSPLPVESRINMPGLEEMCRVLITPVNASDSDVRLRCFVPAAIQYSHHAQTQTLPIPKLGTPVAPNWRQAFFDSLGRVLFIEGQEIPLREL